MFLVSFEMQMNKAIKKVVSLNSIHAFSSYINFKKIVKYFLTILGDFTIDVNGKLTFSKFPEILNCCFSKMQCWNFGK